MQGNLFGRRWCFLEGCLEILLRGLCLREGSGGFAERSVFCYGGAGQLRVEVFCCRFSGSFREEKRSCRER